MAASLDSANENMLSWVVAYGKELLKILCLIMRMPKRYHR
jgi:hypothetical protein